MDDEERLRREAVRRVLAGEPAGAVAKGLRRSERWVFKWQARYDPTDAGWATELSRAPTHVANRTSADLERLILTVRERLQRQDWAQIGSMAIAWELEKLGVRPLPEPRTVERILQRAGVPRRERRSRYAAKGTPYPAPAVPGPNAVQEADLIGPRFLQGGIAFYVLTVMDLGRHAAALELQHSKSDLETARSLPRVWGRLGVPERLKLDNWFIHRVRRSLPAVVRVCLALGVVPVFVPMAEPWRQGTLEHFNDTFDKRFFRTERFSGLRQLRNRMARFERFHNAHHRYAAIRGATPDEVASRLRFVPRRPPADFEVPDPPARRGHIEFIRLIRSDRVLSVLGEAIVLDAEQVHEYVTARLDVAGETLEVFHLGRRIKRLRFRLRD
ncbi:MAG: helix-turn-helix domain-containing protein [Candidatus Limnocylindria bacterium]